MFMTLFIVFLALGGYYNYRKFGIGNGVVVTFFQLIFSVLFVGLFVIVGALTGKKSSNTNAR